MPEVATRFAPPSRIDPNSTRSADSNLTMIRDGSFLGNFHRDPSGVLVSASFSALPKNVELVDLSDSPFQNDPVAADVAEIFSNSANRVTCNIDPKDRRFIADDTNVRMFPDAGHSRRFPILTLEPSDDDGGLLKTSV